ncbi:MAG: aminotransferase class I/II-fold pyridoxal phosphate-dependent enzyme [Planctomycetes bacterium]|nr:aminotransferase class I/II-fold pyridoxal phosphate-dependent enzyme [Planctomycetota bacterium]
MAELNSRLQQANGARQRMVATDGVFSMEGTIAPLAEICELADAYDAAVMVDDSHATGFFGPTGRGTPEYFGVQDRVDVVTSTLGKALGGASGGFTSGWQEIIELLRQRSRPYLFSNTVAPPIVAAAMSVLDIVESAGELRDRLRANTARFRAAMKRAGFQVPDSEHPIVPIMVGDAGLATRMADLLLQEGVYVMGFSYPVVPKGQARIRVQISAAHTAADIDRAVQAFTKVYGSCQP